MAEKLGISDDVKELKLGKSFEKGEKVSFHTFRYDFMPASLDSSKKASVDILAGNQVTVTAPHIEGSGTANTVFKGSKKPSHKECVIIIDHDTGEITLEKLTYNVQLKKTRAEGSSKIHNPNPVEGAVARKGSPNGKLSPKKPPAPQNGKLSPKPRLSPIQKCSPLPRSPLPSPSGSLPGQGSKPVENGFKSPVGNDMSDVGVLSTSNSSSSESSSSDSEDERMESEVQAEAMDTTEESPKEKASESMPTIDFLPSMPKFQVLSEDLQLSESDSDN